jgi:hypothetical protein
MYLAGGRGITAVRGFPSIPSKDTSLTTLEAEDVPRLRHVHPPSIPQLLLAYGLA